MDADCYRRVCYIDIAFGGDNMSNHTAIVITCVIFTIAFAGTIYMYESEQNDLRAKQQAQMTERLIKCYERDVSCPEIRFPSCKTEEYLQILKEVHEAREYEKPNYMCLNFSRAYVDKMVELGYNATIVAGRTRPNSTVRHAWVELVITIDPTSGSVVFPIEDFYVKDAGGI